MNIVQQYKDACDKVITHLKHDMTTLRTGRATPALIEDISVEAYGTMQALKAVASINIADARTLTVTPWDKSVLQDVERALRNADIGVNPVNDGTMIRLPLPPLTEERRKELIKVLHKKMEESRVALRKVREEMRNTVDKAEKAKEIGEDEKFTQYDKVEECIKEYNAEIKTLGEAKEKDIMTV